jgi:hypothetical protein
MTFKVEDLKAKLTENRNGHKALFDKALAGWKAAIQKGAQEVLDTKDDAEQIQERLQALYRHLRAPEDQTATYDTAIEMLEMTTDEKIELTQHQFQCYVKDDWDWKEEWLGSNVAYTEGA